MKTTIIIAIKTQIMISICWIIIFFISYCSPDIIDEGHLKPFGCCGSIHSVESIKGWPQIGQFFEKYARASKPLRLLGAASISPAFKLWTDDYFLNDLKVPKNSVVNIEQGKKENRKAETLRWNFKDYVRKYNDSNIYMVAGLPDYLGRDLVVPPTLQCEPITDSIQKAIMWFSSGGTKSVVHTDAMDNIICLYRGTKTFVLVDPHRFDKQVPIDNPEGAYSSIDVDKVDFKKYPTLKGVEYYRATLNAGDCMFIPYKWIHQVNSVGSNLAVNIWMVHSAIMEMDLSKCDGLFDTKMTMDKVFGNDLTDDADILRTPEQFPFALEEFVEDNDGKITFDDLVRELVGDDTAFIAKAGTGYQDILRVIFGIADHDMDGVITKKDIDVLSHADNQRMIAEIRKVFAIFDLVLEEDEKQESIYDKQHSEL